MKKWLVILLALTVFMGMLSVAALADDYPTFSVTTSQTEALSAGDTFTVDVNISGNTGYTGLGVYMTFNSDVFTFVKAENGGQASSAFSQVNKSAGVGFADVLLGSDLLTGNGCLATVTFQVNDGASAGTYDIGIAIDEFLYGEDEDDIAEKYTDTISTSVTIAAEVVPLSFKDGATEYTYETLHADNYTLTAPGTGYYFAGWFTGLTADGTMITTDADGRYILNSVATDDETSFSATECRPKYDDAPESGAYNALWVNENETNLCAMVLEVYENSFSYRKVTYTDTASEAMSNNDVLRAAWETAAGNGRVKLLKDMKVAHFAATGSSSSNDYIELGLKLDLNGRTMTGINETEAVINARAGEYAIESSHGQGQVIQTAWSTYGSTPVVDVHRKTLSAISVSVIRDIDIIGNSTGVGVVGLATGRATIGSIENVNITVDATGDIADPTKVAAISSSNSIDATVIGSINNCKLTSNGYIILILDSAESHADFGTITNCTMSSSASTYGRIVTGDSKLTFGAGNTITSSCNTLFTGDGELAFTANGTYKCAEGGQVIVDSLNITATPTEGTIAYNDNGTLTFVEGFTVIFKSYDGSEVLWADSYLKGEVPEDHTVEYSYEAGSELVDKHVGWTETLGSETLTDPATLTTSTTLYAVKKQVEPDPVVEVTFVDGWGDFSGQNTYTTWALAWKDTKCLAQPMYYYDGEVTVKLLQDVVVDDKIPVKNIGYCDFTLDLNGHTLTYTDKYDALFEVTSSVSGSSPSITITSSAEEKGTIILDETGKGVICTVNTSGTELPIVVENTRIEAPYLTAKTSWKQNGAPITITNQKANFSESLTLKNVEINAPNAAAVEFSIVSTNATCKINASFTNVKLYGGTVAVGSKGSGKVGTEHVTLTVDAASAFKGAEDTYPIQEVNGNFGLTPNYPDGYVLDQGEDGWYRFVPGVAYTADGEKGLLAPSGDQTITGSTVVFTNPELLSGLDNLTVTGTAATVTFDADALDSIAAATGNVTLNISTKETANDYADKTLVLMLTDDNGTVTFEGTATVTTAIPESEKDYEIFYVNGETRTAMNAVAEDGNLTFTTTHFSEYDVNEQYTFTGITMNGMSETVTGLTNGKATKGTAVTATYSYSGATNIASITATVSGGDEFTGVDNGDGTWTVTVPADKVVGDISVAYTMTDPTFEICYEITGTDTEPDDFYKIEPGASIDVDVYVKTSNAKYLQAFDIYPLWDDMLTYTGISAADGIEITTTAMDAKQPHFQSVSTELNKEVGSDGLKLATLTFKLSEDAVYAEHYPIYFSEASNLAIGYTPQSALVVTIDTTGTTGVETLKTVAVTFDANEGTGTMDAQNVNYNKATALNANTFERTGYTFAGWNTAADGSGTAYDDKAEVTLKEGVTLYAQWTVNSYTITWKNEDGTVLETDEVEYGTTPTYTGETPTKDADEQYSYTFSGWTPTVSEVSGNTTYTATYTSTPQTYTVSLVTNEGTINADDVTEYTFGDGATLPTDVTRTGYTFEGWYEKSDLSGDPVTEISATATGDKTFYAKWKGADYTITFLYNGNTKQENYTPDDDKTLETLFGGTPTRNGYLFATWQITVNDADSWPAVNTSVDNGVNVNGYYGNITLTALWGESDLTITYDYNGGTPNALGNPTLYSVTTTPFTLNNPTRTGYTFLGWTGSNGTTPEVTVKVTPGEGESEAHENLSYKANWDANTYTVTFDENGADGGETMADQSFTYDADAAALTENAFTRTGYTFAGWNTEADGSGDSYADKQEVKNLTDAANGTVILYAQWTANTCTVKFDANGGTGTMADQTFTYDVEQALTANAFTKTGYTFACWNTKADGTGTSYADKKEVKNLTTDSSIVLYAVWTANTYTITYQDEDGNEVGTVTYDTGDSDVTGTIPEVPEKPGYTGEWEDYDLTKTEDQTLNPVYTPITYTITYELDNGTNAADAVTEYTIESEDKLPTPTRDLCVFAGWKVTTAGGNWSENAVIDAGTAVKGFYGDVTLTAQWTTDFKYVVEDYKYATSEYVMLRIADELGDTTKVYTFGGETMFYTTDSAYLVNVTDSGVFFALIEKADYTDNTTLTSAGIAQLAVAADERKDATRDGNVNGTDPVNIADANAVYQMVQATGSYYTLDQLENALRLGADMNRETWSAADHRGSLADVNLIVNMINDAANK